MYRLQRQALVRLLALPREYPVWSHLQTKVSRTRLPHLAHVYRLAHVYTEPGRGKKRKGPDGLLCQGFRVSAIRVQNVRIPLAASGYGLWWGAKK